MNEQDTTVDLVEFSGQSYSLFVETIASAKRACSGTVLLQRLSVKLDGSVKTF
jgi:hypothetical protein